MPKKRLDLHMVDCGLADSRSLAQRLVMAGQVRVDGELVLKPSTLVPENAQVVIERRPAYVSRGGEKLTAALQAFPVSPDGLVCADVGASTGGFSDCLLQHSARRVYAIDVGKGILHWKLRQDPRVVVMEETNARYLECLPEPIALATIDASFISLKILLPVVWGWFSGPEEQPASDTSPAASLPGQVIALVKPQFEVGRREASRGSGVVRDPESHRAVLEEILGFAQAQGYQPRGLIRSPLLGPKGNVEFLLWLEGSQPNAEPTDRSEVSLLIDPLFI
jgi:23S rRNA (cytidine1920-2'-O)/16S rRNA (cytidine1409-2'-O)-methyltransferase